jgi:hypothetical protein
VPSASARQAGRRDPSRQPGTWDAGTKQHVIHQTNTLSPSASFSALSCAYEVHVGHVITPLFLVAEYRGDVSRCGHCHGLSHSLRLRVALSELWQLTLTTRHARLPTHAYRKGEGISRSRSNRQWRRHRPGRPCYEPVWPHQRHLASRCLYASTRTDFRIRLTRCRAPLARMF